ncbi:condensation domain-containing protein [Streptomyces stramineus]
MALSVTQLGEWIFDQRCEGVLSHEPTIVRLEGTLHTAALRAAFAGLQRRHECLRTRFPLIDGVPMQVVEEPRADALPLVDLSALPAGLREREAARIAEETLSAPVRLDDRPPVRQALIRMGRKEHLLLVGIPHITADLWSATLLNDDLMALYGACHDGVPGRPPTAAAQYADYARWQRARWDERRTAGELARWRARLDGLAAADLPLDRPRPYRRRDCFFVGDELDGELSEELRAFARAENVTLYVVLLAAFHALLGQAAGAGRVLTTSLTAARHGRAVQEMTGPFSDYLAVVGDLTGDPDFRELLRRTRDACLIAHDFQRLPFPMVIEGLDPAKELHPHPLEQIEFHLHNTPPPSSTSPVACASRARCRNRSRGRRNPCRGRRTSPSSSTTTAPATCRSTCSSTATSSTRSPPGHGPTATGRSSARRSPTPRRGCRSSSPRTARAPRRTTSGGRRRNWSAATVSWRHWW